MVDPRIHGTAEAMELIADLRSQISVLRSEVEFQTTRADVNQYQLAEMTKQRDHYRSTMEVYLFGGSKTIHDQLNLANSEIEKLKSEAVVMRQQLTIAERDRDYYAHQINVRFMGPKGDGMSGVCEKTGHTYGDSGKCILCRTTFAEDVLPDRDREIEVLTAQIAVLKGAVEHYAHRMDSGGHARLALAEFEILEKGREG